MKKDAIYRVSQVNRYLKEILFQDALLQDIQVLGEISNFKHHKPSGHMYFTLKEEEQILRAVFFRQKNRHLTFLPAEGMSVIARGSTSIYERGGDFQLYIEELEPEGQGALYQAFEQLKEKLQEQGLFDAAHKKPLPSIPGNVGVITSPGSAAVRDFITTLRRRFPFIQLTIYPVAVQGKDSAAQIVQALEVMDRRGEFDVLVITRGGGSLEELWSFNDEGVARAIFQARTPVISAVGHETDFTIADFVADCRASTTTAAAELIAPDRNELEKQVQVMKVRLERAVKNSLAGRLHLLKHLSSARFHRYLRDKIYYHLQRIDELWLRMSRGIKYDLQLKRATVKNLEDRLQALDPMRVLGRGFALVVDENQQLIKGISLLRENREIEVIFVDGRARCLVKEIEKTGE